MCASQKEIYLQSGEKSDCADTEGEISMNQSHKEVSRSQVMKWLEQILDARVRTIVESKIGDNQVGFMKWRGTDDGLFVIRR